jgi:hypothetical protein
MKTKARRTVWIAVRKNIADSREFVDERTARHTKALCELAVGRLVDEIAEWTIANPIVRIVKRREWKVNP